MTSKLILELTVGEDDNFTQDTRLDLTEATEVESNVSIIIFGLLHILATKDLDQYGDGVLKLFSDSAEAGLVAVNKIRDGNSNVIYGSQENMYTM